MVIAAVVTPAVLRNFRRFRLNVVIGSSPVNPPRARGHHEGLFEEYTRQSKSYVMNLRK
jgi:hypothetical protein